MPTYEITSPDGKKYRVNAPEGATKDDALKYIQSQQQKLGAGPAKVLGDVKDTAKDVARSGRTVPIKNIFRDLPKTNADPSIDKSGLPFRVAADIMRADTTPEKDKALHAYDPKAKFGQDNLGREYVTLGSGKRVYVEPYGDTLGGMVGAEAKTTAERLYSRPAETIGAMGGGRAMGIPGAALGGATGRLIDQGVKGLRGLYDQTLSELGIGEAESAGTSGLGEMIARIPGAALKGGLPRWLTGANDDTQRFSESLLKRGAAPRYSQGAPGLAATEFKVQRGEKEGVPKQAEGFIPAVMGHVKDFLAKHGVTDTEGTVQAAKQGGNITLGGEAKYGETLTAKPKAMRDEIQRRVAIREQQNKVLDDQIVQATKQAEAEIRKLQTGVGQQSADYRATIAEDLGAAKAARSARAATNYAKVEAADPGIQLNMTGVANSASKILGAIAKDPKGAPILADPQGAAPGLRLLKQLQAFGKSNKGMPLMEAARLRTQLNKIISKGGFLPPSKIHYIGELEESLDNAIKAAASTNPEVEKALAKAQSEYAADSKKIDFALAKRLVKEARQTGSVDANNVIPLITKDPKKLGMVWDVLKPESRRRVSRGIFDYMIEKSTVGGKLSGQKFLDQLQRNGAIINRVFGDEGPKMFKAARGLQALEGSAEISGRNLMPENIVQALETAAATQKKMDAFYAKNALAAMVPETDAGKAAAAAAKAEVAQAAAARTAKAATQPASREADRAERAAVRERIRTAGETVGATPEKRIEIKNERLGKAKEEAAEFDKDMFGKLADPQALKDGAVDYLIRPRETERLIRARDFYGEDSAPFKALQEAFFRKAVAAGTRELSDPTKAFSGDGIRDFLKAYTPEQRKILLKPYGMNIEVPGKYVAGKMTKPTMRTLTGEEALNDLAKFYDFAFPEARTTAAFSAGESMGKVSPTMFFNPGKWPALTKYGKEIITAHLLKHPAAFKLLVTGFEYPKTDAGQKAMMLLDNAIRLDVQSQMDQMK